MATSIPPSVVLSEHDAEQDTRSPRSSDPRSRLLSATLECLVERGYAATTLAEIERRAGLSRGAHSEYFAKRAQLFGAAVDQLFQGLAEQFAHRYAQLSRGEGGCTSTLHLLWDYCRNPAYVAVMELCLAARNDPELRITMRAVSERHEEALRAVTSACFPKLVQTEGLLESIEMTLAGLIVRRALYGESAGEEQTLNLVEKMVGHFTNADAEN